MITVYLFMHKACPLIPRTPRRNAVPLRRKSSANILVASRASSILAPEATTAQTIAPADEPANGVVSCQKEILQSWEDIIKLQNLSFFSKS